MVWSEKGIKSALFGWLAAQAVENSKKGTKKDSAYHRGLADGYVGALEMVLREEPEQ